MRKKIKILHIDDEKESLDITKAFLCRINPNVVIESVSEIKKAITRILSNKFNVIISDFNLSSDLNGLDLFIFINSSKKWKQVPFIIFSGTRVDKIEDKLKKYGIKLYLSKQGKPENTYEKLNNMIVNSLDKKFLSNREDLNFQSNVTLNK